MKHFLLYLLLLFVSVSEVKAEVDPNFYIFLCFGQSNMEGAMPPEPVDVEYVDDRFQALACADFSSPNRIMGQWYTAYPPIVRENTYLGIADYFGRTMVAGLPAEYKVGVVDVAIGGSDIRAFMPEMIDNYPNAYKAYNYDPYTRLVEMAKIAQNDGVIKGILLHQGEANCGQEEWPQWVKTIYERLLNDLGLNAADVPLLVGELISASDGGACAEHNIIIGRVPNVIPTAHIVHSAGCPPCPDYMHFALPGYRLMGKRYALKMLSLLGFPTYMDVNYQLPQNLHRLYKATSLSTFPDISLDLNNSYNLAVTAFFEDDHTEDVTGDVVISCSGEGVMVNGNELTAVSEESTLVTVSYTDFIGETVSTSFYVNKSVSPEVIITANDISREYGEPNPVFDYTTEGGSINGIPDFYCDATELSPVGTYPIRISKGGITDDNVTFVDGTLTITKAPLTITAKDCTREEGQENPYFEVIYDGFKNGETETVLTCMPTVTTTASQGSEPGYYDIDVYGAEAQNYDIIYIKGILTVTEKDEVDFTIDGTTYQGSKSGKTAVVTSVDTSLMSLEIPASVCYDGTIYQVTGIDEHAFDNSNLAALVWDVEALLPENAFGNANVGSNFLLYVKSVSYAPSSIKNVVVNDTAQTLELSDEGGLFYCPRSFTAMSISYTHNYSMETGEFEKGWETIVLPYDVQKIVHSTNGEIVPFALYGNDSGQKPFWLAKYFEGNFKWASSIEANEPYIIAMPNNSKYQKDFILSGDVTFSSENMQVPKTPTFSGTFIPAFANVAKSSTVYALNVNNRYTNYTGNFEPGSCFIANLRDIRPFEAYIYISDSSTRDVIEINLDEPSSEISDIMHSTVEGHKVLIHSLSGLQVVSTTLRDFDKVWSNLPRGVYIVYLAEGGMQHKIGKKWIR
jgi:hypothetical protein